MATTEEQKPPNKCVRFMAFTSVIFIILLLTIYSMYIHYDFAMYPQAPKAIFTEDFGWAEYREPFSEKLRKSVEWVLLLLMGCLGLLIIYRYYIAFTSDPGTYTLESNSKIEHKPDKLLEI